jgi:hypothetical protein
MGKGQHQKASTALQPAATEWSLEGVQTSLELDEIFLIVNSVTFQIQIFVWQVVLQTKQFESKKIQVVFGLSGIIRSSGTEEKPAILLEKCLCPAPRVSQIGASSSLISNLSSALLRFKCGTSGACSSNHAVVWWRYLLCGVIDEIDPTLPTATPSPTSPLEGGGTIFAIRTCLDLMPVATLTAPRVSQIGASSSLISNLSSALSRFKSAGGVKPLHRVTSAQKKWRIEVCFCSGGAWAVAEGWPGFVSTQTRSGAGGTFTAA